MSQNPDTTVKPVLAKKDYMSDQIIRWCPGCGDYAILAQAQTVFAELQIPREELVIISGIGCSSRFPYYINSYGFHTIHGRAPAVATGLKMTRPELDVWIATGDGDALSIGGNHLIHLMRRNLDVQVLMFNNRIYGLTKGQYSPTSEIGKVTKSTPDGSLDHPFTPVALALGADASFVARSVDIFVKELREVMTAAHAHKGTAFVEIYQNCNIFNDGAFDSVTDKKTRDQTIVFAEHGKPLLFGSGKKGLRWNTGTLEAIDLGEGKGVDDCVVHDETNRTLAEALGRLVAPTAMGVLYRKPRPVFEQAVRGQLDAAKAKGMPDLAKAIAGKNTWTVK